MSEAAAVSAPPAGPLLGFGEVRHTRLRPRRNAFAYASCFLMLPMRSLRADPGQSALAVNRAGLLSFHDSDHGDGRGPERGGALAWLDELLANEGIDDAAGEVWLHCYPRMLGHTFKPVSFWYCHDANQQLRAIVVEVNNTFGERHCYLLDRPRYGHELQASKVFHVSPFCPIEGQYRFRFMRTCTAVGDERTVVRIDYEDAQGPLLQTSVSGTLLPVSSATLRRAVLRYPALTLVVVTRIHWQALKLLFKRARFFSKPGAPDLFVTR